jgi:hypothetical protein
VEDAPRGRVAALRDLPYGRRGKPRGPGEQCVRVPTPTELGLEALAHDAHRELALERRPARVQDRHPGRVRAPAGVGDEARLADARLAFDQDRHARARRGGGERGLETRDLACSVEQRFAEGSAGCGRRSRAATLCRPVAYFETR